MKTWLPWFLGSLLFLVVGCRSAAAPSASISSELAPPVATETPKWKPVSFVDRPELHSGTGPIDPDIAPDFTGTESGLSYRVLRKSDGEKPTAASTVTVHYRGWLNSGKVFDSSYERGEPTTFPLGNVIAAWTEGMQLVGEGGMIELWVPSHLGYGERGSPGTIPAHSNLQFVIELVSVD